MEKNHRRLLSDTIDITQFTLSGEDIFKLALWKHIGRQGNKELTDLRATEAYWKFEWNGRAPEYVVNFCIDLLVKRKPKKAKNLLRH